VAIGAGCHRAGAGARRFQPGGAVAFGQAQDAETGAIALLGMGPLGENRFDERGRLRADRLRPADDPGRRPFQMALVRLGHVGGVRGVPAADIGAAMRGDSLAAVKDLDGAHACAHVDGLVHERVRDGVVMAVQFDVIVDVDPGGLPLAVDEGFRG
jgi:hypothetical protein